MRFKEWVIIGYFLALPWQTRWFYDAGALAGYPWEQGRFSVYASWFLIVLLTFLSIKQKPLTLRVPKKTELLVIIGIVLPALFSFSQRASIAWLWIFAIAALSIWVLRREQIAIEKMSFWFAIALVPHALIGLAQWIFQWSLPSKWLGLALLNPQSQGTAVILSEGIRYLRIYGGFPHPNIFGGYLAVSLLFVAIAWGSYNRRMQKVLFYVVPLLVIALGFTASRSAWLSLFGGLLAHEVLLRKDRLRKHSTDHFHAHWILIPFILTLAIFPLLVRPISSGSGQFAEQKSVSERVLALKQAWPMIKQRPLLGTGQGALLPALIEQELKPVIPHIVPIVILIETGIVGFITLLYVFVQWLSMLLDKIKRYPTTRPAVMSLIVALCPIVVLDHYLWSYWPGFALLSLIVVFTYEYTPTS
ncbi:MAG TPA: O-antigen ligase family protein [bacterium]|nr:MAG: O-antigen ligase family protein [Candidatus Nomurabacteria bacterium]HPF94989.1 O-antigen ligase family protein [bacterium]